MTRLVALTVVVAAGCMGSINGQATAPDAGSAGSGGSDGVDAGSGASENATIARARLWVDAQVPYCQAPNHGKDLDSSCASTCTRPDVADWDPYRSDCSGFVSWAWALPAPGRTTGDFAPFTKDITHTIDGAELRAGDALNNDEHIVLFEAWKVVGKTAMFMEEPGCSSATPYAHEFSADVTLDGDSVDILHHGTFTAIRYDDAP